MDTNPFPPPSPAYPPTASAGAIPPQVTHPYGGEYNTNWGVSHQQTFLHHANQLTGGVTSTAGAVANNFQCKWAVWDQPCNQVFASVEELVVHEGNAHDVQGAANRGIVCRWITDRGLCDKKLRRDGFKRHFCTHLGLSIQCYACAKRFSRKDSMKAHFVKEHGSDLPLWM